MQGQTAQCGPHWDAYIHSMYAKTANEERYCSASEIHFPFLSVEFKFDCMVLVNPCGFKTVKTLATVTET